MTVEQRRTRPEFSGVRVLVTGATGFLGARLVDRLLKAGHAVHALSRQREDTRGSVRWWRADLLDERRVQDVIRDAQPEVIFHLAGDAVGRREPEWVLPLLRGHVLGTANLLTAALGSDVRRIVMTGSMEEPEPGSESACPSSPYAAAKWASSAYARMFHALYGSPVVLLRLFMVYGPGRQDLRKLIPSVVLSLLRGEPPVLASGDRQIDWVYVDDVVDAFIAAAAAGSDVEGRTLDVGSGRLITIRDLVADLVRVVGTDIEPQFGRLPDRPMEQVRKADRRESRRRLDWEPRTSLEEGLRITVDWYRSLPEASISSGP